MTLSAVKGRCFWLGTWCCWIRILMLTGCISFCLMLQIHLRLQLLACEKRLRHALQRCNERWCVWVAWTWGCRWNKNSCCICQAAMRRAEAAEVCPRSIWLNWRLTLICTRARVKWIVYRFCLMMVVGSLDHVGWHPHRGFAFIISRQSPSIF